MKAAMKAAKAAKAAVATMAKCQRRIGAHETGNKDDSGQDLSDALRDIPQPALACGRVMS